MRIYAHRINSSNELKSIPNKYGVEIDLRTFNNEIILAHDPFVSGEKFIDWLDSWTGQNIILNVKEDGLESRILDILNIKNIEDFFFLDQSFPTMVKMHSLGKHFFATRVSEFESLEAALSLTSKWIWLDSYMANWDYILKAIPEIHSYGRFTCLVSPELQRVHSDNELRDLQSLISTHGLFPTAVCTKYIDKWTRYEKA